jgi:hypothetical protein
MWYAQHFLCNLNTGRFLSPAPLERHTPITANYHRLRIPTYSTIQYQLVTKPHVWPYLMHTTIIIQLPHRRCTNNVPPSTIPRALNFSYHTRPQTTDPLYTTFKASQFSGHIVLYVVRSPSVRDHNTGRYTPPALIEQHITNSW